MTEKTCLIGIGNGGCKILSNYKTNLPKIFLDTDIVLDLLLDNRENSKSTQDFLLNYLKDLYDDSSRFYNFNDNSYVFGDVDPLLETTLRDRKTKNISKK